MDEPAIDFIEQQMMERGYLDSREMSNMFNLLRSNDLIWANVVNNYLMGDKPPAFDLLYWNSDGTRMARAAHSWYLRNTYVENNLIEPGKIMLKGEPIDLGSTPGHLRGGRGKGPHRAVGRRLADHPADRRRRALRAGVQRPHRRDHQSSGRQGAPTGSANPACARPPPPSFGCRVPRATKELVAGLGGLALRPLGSKNKPPAIGSANHPPMEDAPGTYVLEK